MKTQCTPLTITGSTFGIATKPSEHFIALQIAALVFQVWLTCGTCLATYTINCIATKTLSGSKKHQRASTTLT